MVGMKEWCRIMEGNCARFVFSLNINVPQLLNRNKSARHFMRTTHFPFALRGCGVVQLVIIRFRPNSWIQLPVKTELLKWSVKDEGNWFLHLHTLCDSQRSIQVKVIFLFNIFSHLVTYWSQPGGHAFTQLLLFKNKGLDYMNHLN